MAELRGGSCTGHGGFWSFPGSTASQSPRIPQALHSRAVTLCAVLVFLMGRFGIAQQPLVSQSDCQVGVVALPSKLCSKDFSVV